MLSQVSGERSSVVDKSNEATQHTTDCSRTKSWADTTLQCYAVQLAV